MINLSLQDVSKNFKALSVVSNVNLEIQAGEFFSIVGPSGCGKTTLLRMIAGFESPATGRILIGGHDMTRIPPEARSVGMVFQNYALFPHMTVFENVAFGLQAKKTPKKEIQIRVENILEAVHLTEKIHTPVPNLSGGEQQRVAVARALVVEPTVLLFDEPLSNLDVTLRVSTREEIRMLQRRTKITTVYVTHDQSEAMSLSDRIAVMRSGAIEQIGTPSEIYESPRSPFVAQFLGGANLLTGSIDLVSNALVVDGWKFPLSSGLAYPRKGPVRVAVKPEAISLFEYGTGGDVDGVIQEAEYLGFTTNFKVLVHGISLRVTAMSSMLSTRLALGSKVGVSIDLSRSTLFSGD